MLDIDEFSLLPLARCDILNAPRKIILYYRHLFTKLTRLERGLESQENGSIGAPARPIASRCQCIK